MSEDTLAQLRDSFEASQKENKKLLAQVESLLKENRTMKAISVVTEAGLSAELADLFIVANPDADITVEAVQGFAEKYGIVAPAAPEVEIENETQTPPPTDGLSNIARAGSRNSGGGAAPSGQKVLTRDEFLTLREENPEAAKKALAEGRVRLRSDNPMASGSTTRLNPFLASRETET